jgi:hypothetical protein
MSKVSFQVSGLPPDVPSLGECGNIYIKEGDEGYTRKTWKFCLQEREMKFTVHLQTSQTTVLDIHIPISRDSQLLQMIHKEVCFH